MSHVAAALEVYRRLAPGQPPWNDPAVRAMFDAAERAAPADRDAMARALAVGLADADTHRASCIAISLGTFVEYGADPEIAGLAIVDRIRAITDDDPDPGDLEMFDKAAMAHLCRRMPLRIAARAGGPPGIAEVTAPWTSGVLELVDDLELLVLAPEHARGWRVRLEAIKTCAHLFTLLQAAVIPPMPGEPVDPHVIAIATGETPLGEGVNDHQRFRFDDWTGLATPTTFAGGLGGFLPVDLSPALIRPLPDGRRVVLIGAPLFGGRSWDSGFFANVHDALRSRVEIVETLDTERATAELAAIAALRS